MAVIRVWSGLELSGSAISQRLCDPVLIWLCCGCDSAVIRAAIWLCFGCDPVDRLFLRGSESSVQSL